MKRLLVVLSIFAVQGLQAQRNSDVIDYINTYKELAIREMQRSGVPASITLAQGIHESMAGKSDLVQRSNNHFGIKCRAEWKGEKVYHDDDARGECFRSYTKADESYVDHSDFLRKGQRYAFLFEYEPTDYNKWAYGLKKAGYATNPRYPQIIIKYIEDYNLQQYTLIAMGKLSPQDEILAGGGKPVSIGTGVAIREINLPATAKPVVEYPLGQFTINRTKVIFAKAGASMLGIAREYDVSLKHLLDFNELSEEEDDDVLAQDQLIFLQRKRKSGEGEFHEVKPGETLYDISQSEGIRLESLIVYNHLQEQGEPATGEKLYLQSKAPERPKLAKEVVVEAPKPPVVTPDQITPANSSAVTASLHIVREKETLYSIAKKYSITVEQLRDWNKLAGNGLKTGQELVIYKN
ncbi:LysM peptidoglycan-binding domain-containing protein [Niastella caeni]|uniref:Peptidoglycan hydrolase n=1 Tax=Niastella caeni TaxID=2569763 RepID=A0A4S8HF75_9BACT|nr:glucosaminidase domain-containing protein [Niastella caeni]THU33475.1 LysM peptidoglycan-binding domain-containing protein [Niastella caeni]